MGDYIKIVAIDPGLSGAVVYYNTQGHSLSFHRDFKNISEIAEAASVGQDCTGLGTRTYRAIIELVGSRPGQGIVSTSHFMIAYGVALGSLGSCVFREEIKAPVFSVHPVRWQNWVKKEIGIFDDCKLMCKSNLFKPDFVDFDSRVYATTCFPDYVSYFSRRKDHNTADAVLLAVYCYWFSREILLKEHLSRVWAYHKGHISDRPVLPCLEGVGLDKFPQTTDNPYSL